MDLNPKHFHTSSYAINTRVVSARLIVPFIRIFFMHSESLKIHETAVTLFQQNGIQANYDFELKHRQIIEEFGRYPHRNKILGRASTEKEASCAKHCAESLNIFLEN
jgi:uncharacterized protein (DUF924 family)